MTPNEGSATIVKNFGGFVPKLIAAPMVMYEPLGKRYNRPPPEHNF